MKLKIYDLNKIIPQITNGEFQPHYYNKAAIITANGKTLIIDREAVHQLTDGTVTLGLNKYKINENGVNAVYFVASHEGTFDIADILNYEHTEMYLDEFFRYDYDTHHRITANVNILRQSFIKMGLDMSDYFKPKKKYLVSITETLEKQIEVEAENGNAAFEKAKEMIYKSDICLTDDDSIGVDVEVLWEIGM